MLVHFTRFIVLFTVIINTAAFSQSNYDYKFDDEAAADSIPLVTEYEAYNKILGGDSLRYCGTHLCVGWIRDEYPCGTLKHRGYYLDGQLSSVYKNYYQNGQLEREFKVRNHRKSLLKVYYPDGTLLSDIEYDYNDPVSWTDYYPNGQIEYTEKYHKSKVYILYRKFFAPDGTPESITQLSNKRRLLYDRIEYYENGNIKEKGNLAFNTSMGDYQRTGKWQFFDKNGVLVLEETYYRNRVVNDEGDLEELDDDDED